MAFGEAFANQYSNRFLESFAFSNRTVVSAFFRDPW